jgi:hypothetical protein
MSLTPPCSQLCRISSRMIQSIVFIVFCFGGNLTPSVYVTAVSLKQLLRGANYAAVTCTAVTSLCKYNTAVTLDFIFERLWLPFKGISIKKHTVHRHIFLHYIYNFHTQNMGVNFKDCFSCHSGVIVAAVTKISDFIVNFLRKVEAIFKML